MKNYDESRKDFKKREPEQCKVLRTFLELLRKAKQNLRIAEKIQAATGKNNEKVEANYTGFSAEFFGSKSVPELDKNPTTSS